MRRPHSWISSAGVPLPAADETSRHDRLMSHLACTSERGSQYLSGGCCLDVAHSVLVVSSYILDSSIARGHLVPNIQDSSNLLIAERLACNIATELLALESLEVKLAQRH